MVQRKTNDRTQVTEVQKRFEADLYHRLIRDDNDTHDGQPLRQAITERVVDEDALQLAELRYEPGEGLVPVSAQLDFDFPENPDAAAAFEDWLHDEIDAGILETADRSAVVEGRHYSAEYIRQASEQGVKHADRELSRAGASEVIPDDDSLASVLRTPAHQDIMSSAYVRAYDELDGITSDMATEISRTMSDALADGVNPRETARRMNDRVDKVGMTRARRMARTETARTYNLHSAARYDDLGVTEVEVLTASPCDACADLASQNPHPVENAGGLLPVHPNCVCSISPIPETME